MEMRARRPIGVTEQVLPMCIAKLASTPDEFSRARSRLILAGGGWRPIKVELVLNLRTSKTLGITFPLSLLGRANKVIE